ncbi:MAG: prepilin peptidase, partial [Firmicutes bacterium]|nr:prepilin peptidase [Bacillota bacterium]
WLATALLFAGDSLHTGLYCALFTLLLVLAVIDWRTYTLPNGLNLAVLVLGVVQLAADFDNWPTYLLGMCSVSLFFLLLWWLTGGAGIGMGDVKLMAAAGLLLGGPRILLAMIVGSVLGVIIHSLRMRRGAGNKLAFGPYLAAGIWYAALLGRQTITAYLGIFGL